MWNDPSAINNFPLWNMPAKLLHGRNGNIEKTCMIWQTLIGFKWNAQPSVWSYVINPPKSFGPPPLMWSLLYDKLIYSLSWEAIICWSGCIELWFVFEAWIETNGLFYFAALVCRATVAQMYWIWSCRTVHRRSWRSKSPLFPNPSSMLLVLKILSKDQGDS